MQLMLQQNCENIVQCNSTLTVIRFCWYDFRNLKHNFMVVFQPKLLNHLNSSYKTITSLGKLENLFKNSVIHVNNMKLNDLENFKFYIRSVSAPKLLNN